MMTSECLSNLLQDWRRRIKQLSTGEESRDWLHRTQKALVQARNLVVANIMFSESGEAQGVYLDPDDEYYVTISLLAASIGEALTSSVRRFPGHFPRRGIDWGLTLTRSDKITRGMIAKGWCPFTVKMLSDDVCALMYASTREPYLREGSNGHQNCTRETCVVNNIDESTYAIKHAVSDCKCVYTTPILDNVVEALQNHKVPVVQLAEGSKLITTDASQAEYVAISHIWADGLGSTTESGLPACQIERIAAMTGQLVPGGQFWMDSVCVPRIRDMRKRAIGLMARTYQDASAVLVIDAGIRSCSASAPLEKRLLRVVSSVWMQRLWTLQEGFLARVLVFEFSDGLLRLDDMLPCEEEDVYDVLLTALTSPIFRFTKYQQYRQLEHNPNRFNFGLGDVARSLVWRSTSKSEDETLAISGLLNVSASELVELPLEERMKSLLLRLKNLPRKIIFTRGERLKHLGFRWAPASLMNNIGRLEISSEAKCTPKGLLAE